jgi:hypothetical protein
MYKAEAKPNHGLVSKEYGYRCPHCKRESACAADAAVVMCLCGVGIELTHEAAIVAVEPEHAEPAAPHSEGN